jgi:branched-chain amino acid transport system ATP-binding protein
VRGDTILEIDDLHARCGESHTLHGVAFDVRQGETIARILRTGADIILLDEPTEGLAPVAVERIGEVLRLLKQRGVTMVLVEQNFHFARKLADRYVVIEHGRAIDHFGAAEIQGKTAGLAEQLGV